MDNPPYQGIAAIETVYAGNIYRSRLEARWAVFFRTLEIPFVYEPEGFNLDGLRYLPDFWLSDQKCFFEVKGPFTENAGERKARALSIASNFPVFIFYNIPPVDAFPDHLDSYSGDAFYPGGEDKGYLWCRSSCCGKYEIQFEGRSDRIKCCEPNIRRKREFTPDHPSILYAFMAARQCRFDGE